jgi:hypothetical protein
VPIVGAPGTVVVPAILCFNLSVPIKVLTRYFSVSPIPENFCPAFTSATIDFDLVGQNIQANVIDGSITDVKIASGINAAKIADGSVSNTESMERQRERGYDKSLTCPKKSY